MAPTLSWAADTLPPPAAPLQVLSNDSASGLLAALDDRDFVLEQVRAGTLAVPRLYVTELPSDMKALEDSDLRKDLFLRTLLPLVLMVNEQILADRYRLLRLRMAFQSGQSLEASDLIWLDQLADYYGVAVGDLDELARRVDVVPVSMTLAQAIEESGWGTSRYAREGNALFGQRTWQPSAPSMLASRDGVPLDHRARAFPDLAASVESYMHNLNTHRAYRKWRGVRAEQRAENGVLDPHVLTELLTHYAENATYGENLQRLIRHNDLEAFDNAHLASGALAERLAPAIEADSVPLDPGG